MKNLNKLVLKTTDPFLLVVQNSGSSVIQDFVDIDSLANDLGKDIDVCAMQVSLSISRGANHTSAQIVVFETSIGLQAKDDVNTNLFRWIQNFATYADFGDVTYPELNQTLGNFRDVLFTIPKFSSQLTGGQASKGQLFLNLKVANQDPSAAVSMNLHYKAYITLYYN